MLQAIHSVSSLEQNTKRDTLNPFAENPEQAIAVLTSRFATVQQNDSFKTLCEADSIKLLDENFSKIKDELDRIYSYLNTTLYAFSDACGWDYLSYIKTIKQFHEQCQILRQCIKNYNHLLQDMKVVFKSVKTLYEANKLEAKLQALFMCGFFGLNFYLQQMGLKNIISILHNKTIIHRWQHYHHAIMALDKDDTATDTSLTYTKEVLTLSHLLKAIAEPGRQIHLLNKKRQWLKFNFDKNVFPFFDNVSTKLNTLLTQLVSQHAPGGAFTKGLLFLQSDPSYHDIVFWLRPMLQQYKTPLDQAIADSTDAVNTSYKRNNTSEETNSSKFESVKLRKTSYSLRLWDHTTAHEVVQKSTSAEIGEILSCPSFKA